MSKHAALPLHISSNEGVTGRYLGSWTVLKSYITKDPQRAALKSSAFLEPKSRFPTAVMMEITEVNEKSKALQKATAADSPPEKILNILNELKAGVKANEDLLRSTKIGIIVNRSKLHKNPAISKLATEIVKKWRDDIQKQKGTASPATNGKKGSSPSGTASPAPANGMGETKGKPSVPLDQRNYKVDKVDIDRTNQSTRDSCIGLIYNGLCHTSPNPASEIIVTATAIEAAAFSVLGPETNNSYSTKMRSLFQNLKMKSNPQLRVRVLNGEIPPERFVRMTGEELKSEERYAALAYDSWCEGIEKAV